MTTHYTQPIDVFVDGSSRGNPGPSAIGIIAYLHGARDTPIHECGKPIGIATNNIAEYEALIHALKWLIEKNPPSAVIHLDSELVYKQVCGTYRVKNQRMAVQLKRVMRLVTRIQNVKFTLVPRKENKDANRLAQKASAGEKKPRQTFDQGRLL